MSHILDKEAVERALKEAAHRSTSWQHWEKHNRAGQLELVPGNGEMPESYEVSRFTVSLSDLRKLPEEHLRGFLVASKIANEMLLLQRQAIIHQNAVLRVADSVDKDEWAALNAIAFNTFTHLAGKLWEAYEALQKHSRLFAPGSGLELDEFGKKARTNLNSAFGSGSPLSQIRNKIAFHFDLSLLQEQLGSAAWRDETDFELILSSDFTNTLFLTTEAISAFAVLDIVGPSENRQKAMDCFYDLVTENAGHMMKYATSLISAILDKNIAICEGKRVEMGQRPKLDDVPAPFLVQPSRR